MNNRRKNKLIIIVSLIVVIVGMSIGFAAFSASLTISSSATVTPDSSGFKLKMYGFTGEDYDNDYYNIDKYTSETISNILVEADDKNGSTFTGLSATIDSDNLKLNMGTINIKEPGNFGASPFKIKNEGNYDAYINLSQFDDFSPLGSCVADEGTSQKLVDGACSYIYFTIYDFFSERSLLAQKEYHEQKISNEELETIMSEECFYGDSQVCKIGKGESVFVMIGVFYDEGDDVILADGPFSVSFPDFKIEFTTTPPNVES